MNTDEGQPSGPTNDPRFLMTLMMPSALTSAGRLTSRKGESAGGKGTSAGEVGCVCSARPSGMGMGRSGMEDIFGLFKELQLASGRAQLKCGRELS